jgi:hypothetical protein
MKPTNKRPEFVTDEAIEHMRTARAEMRKSIEALFPPGFITRRRAARKEMLLAFRSIIDAAIVRIDRQE